MVYQKDEMELLKWFYELKCDKIEIDGLKPIDENIKIIISKISKVKKFERNKLGIKGE